MYKSFNADNPYRSITLVFVLLSSVPIINLFLWKFDQISYITLWGLFGFFVISIFFTLRTYQQTWATLLFLATVLIVMLHSATLGWDARSIWLYHAKVIFYENSLYATLKLDSFTGHADYPVGFSALAASLAKLLNSWNEVYPKSATWPFMAAPLLLITNNLQENKKIIIFLCLLVLSCGKYIANGYMDVLVALYILALLIVLQNISQQSSTKKYLTNHFLFILVFCLAFNLLNLKNEGMAAVIIIGVLSLFWLPPKQRTIVVISFGFSLFVYLFTWKIPVLNAGLSIGLFNSQSISQLIDRMTNLNELGLILVAFIKNISLGLGMLAIAHINSKSTNYKIIPPFPIIFLALYVGLLFTIYIITPHDLRWHLSSSANRTLMPVNIGLMFFALKAFDIKR